MILKNGHFKGFGKGFKSKIELEATIDGGKLDEIKLINSHETPNVGEKALPKLLAEANKNKNFHVDTVSGASFTSDGFNEALKSIKIAAQGQSLEKTSSVLKDGTYQLTLKSYQNLGIYHTQKQTRMKVTFENNKIKSIEVPQYTDTSVIGGMAFKLLAKRIIAHQSTDVDVITGASVSSNAFLKGINEAINKAGGDPDLFAHRKIKAKIVKPEEGSVDVVVIGCGMAGFSAAIEAAKNGARVTLLNSGETFGNSSSKAGGYVMAAQTQEQAKRNIKDTPSAFYKDLLQVYGDEKNVRPKMLKILANDSASFITFLSDLGLKWQDVVNVASREPRRTKRAHIIKGQGSSLMEVFNKAAVKYNVDLRLGVNVNDLIIENGQVVGVKATRKNGGQITLHAKAVVVCAGSYTGRRDLIKKYNPSMTNLEIVTGNGDGSALRLFSQAKANIIDVPYPQLIYSFYGASWHSYPEKVPESPVMANYDILSVDGNGKRVVSEDQFAFTFAKYVWRHGFDEGYSIFGQKVADMYPNMTKLALTTSTVHGKPFGYKEDNIKLLAKDVGINPDNLEKTVRRYNKLCEKGHDDDFGKDASHMIAIKSPYYIIRLPQNITDGYTGAEINENAQVINKAGHIIPGLYAAGSDADAEVMGIDYYGDGMSLLNCGVFGRRAAKDIIQKLNKN